MQKGLAITRLLLLLLGMKKRFCDGETFVGRGARLLTAEAAGKLFSLFILLFLRSFSVSSTATLFSTLFCFCVHPGRTMYYFGERLCFLIETHLDSCLLVRLQSYGHKIMVLWSSIDSSTSSAICAPVNPKPDNSRRLLQAKGNGHRQGRVWRSHECSDVEQHDNKTL